MFQKAAKLQAITTKPVYIPKVELNHELIKSICQGTADIKTELKRCIRQTQDKEPSDSGNISNPLHAPPLGPLSLDGSP